MRPSGRSAVSSRALAREGPVVIVIDDIHWAEPNLLDLHRVRRELLVRGSDPLRLPHAARAPGGAADLGCSARERQRRDAGAARRRTRLRRSSRGCCSSATLGGDDLRRILEAADGNPLFLEQLLALNADADGRRRARRYRRRSRRSSPPGSISSTRESGSCCGRAAVQGRAFHRRALVGLLPAGRA